mgnify:CR=1 FL=1
MLDLATAEYSLVGCVLIDARCLPAAREILPTAEAFASEPCRKAYAAACRLEDEDKGIDPVIVGRAAGLSNDFLMQCMDCRRVRQGRPGWPPAAAAAGAGGKAANGSPLRRQHRRSAFDGGQKHPG